MARTLEQAKLAADVGYQVTGGKFCVIPDPDCEGYYLSIPKAEYAVGIDPPLAYETAKGKVY